ncbi:hypothetical protein AALB39_21555 [Lachnospiraceae bacterium 54-53]
MNCLKKSFFLINGAKLQSCRENHFNFYLKRRSYQIIRGTVYNKNREPCAGAAVQVTQINCGDQSRSMLGYTLTDENGNYLFSLEAKPHMKYELAVFAPLLRSEKEGSC